MCLYIVLRLGIFENQPQNIKSKGSFGQIGISLHKLHLFGSDWGKVGCPFFGERPARIFDWKLPKKKASPKAVLHLFGNVTEPRH